MEKTVYQRIAFFFTLFKGYQCNKSYEINPTKRFSLEPEKTNFKRNEDFTCVFSIPVKFIWDLFSWSSVRNCLWCYYRSLITSIALERCKKRMRYRLKYSGTRFFVHWKLESLIDNYLMDSVLTRRHLRLVNVGKMTIRGHSKPFEKWPLN